MLFVEPFVDQYINYVKILKIEVKLRPRLIYTGPEILD